MLKIQTWIHLVVCSCELFWGDSFCPVVQDLYLLSGPNQWTGRCGYALAGCRVGDVAITEPALLRCSPSIHLHWIKLCAGKQPKSGEDWPCYLFASPREKKVSCSWSGCPLEDLVASNSFSRLLRFLCVAWNKKLLGGSCWGYRHRGFFSAVFFLNVFWGVGSQTQ